MSRTQTVDLKKGWNAVFLEVEPSETTPGEMFQGLPIDIVAHYFRLERPVQFITDPSERPWNREGWGVWYGPDRADAFLSNLYAIHGYRSYLIHATENHAWKVSGEVRLRKVGWTADSYNLQGFSVDPGSPPTFGQFFRNAEAHEGQPVYRLVNNKWVRVTNPDATAIRRGEAYWVYSKGGSAFQGPTSVELAFGEHLSYSKSSTANHIKILNHSEYPAEMTLEKTGSSNLPLALVVRGVVPGSIRYMWGDLPENYRPPTLEAGDVLGIRLDLQREAIGEEVQAGLLKVTSDAGMLHWVPVAAAAQ